MQSPPDTYPVSTEAVRQIPLARLGAADDVARVVAFLLSEDAAYIAGPIPMHLRRVWHSTLA
jgi:NAD(P)-dependent dehydrogenase (short-subunit alcohol dehydrogenase family)